MQKLFGYRPEDVSTKYEWWLQRVHPDDRDRVTGSIRKVVEGNGKTWSGEYRFRRQDETYATVLDRGYIIRDSAGKPVRLVGGLSDLSEQRMAERALANYREQLRALSVRLQTGREEERANMAREIHDDLGQTLTATKLNLDWLERHLAEQKDEATFNPLLERVVESGEMVESAIQSVQRIATDLRPALLDNLGLGEALQEESQRFEQRSGIKCQVQLPTQSLKFAPQMSIAIFRVFQEALTNVARHAQATELSILLVADKGLVTLCIEDNGKGISPRAISDPRSIGLIGMVERASALGGKVSFEPMTPHGTRVTLQLPLSESAGLSSGAL
jgi:PAS domain S-box-containing protein